MRRVLWAWAALCLTWALVACGGGGGGGGGFVAAGTGTAPATATTATNAAGASGGSAGGAEFAAAGGGGTPVASLSFAPSELKGNFDSGASGNFSVVATVSDPSVFGSTVYVYLVDSQRVLANRVVLSPIGTDRKSYYAVLYTSPTLAIGRYLGNLEVHVCRDVNCAAEYPGSPASLPYDLTITARALAATPIASTVATVHKGAPLSKAVSVRVNGPDLAWTATSDVDWLKLTNGKGNGSGSFVVDYDVAGLDVGTYTGAVTVRGSDDQTSKVTFTLQVLPTQFSMTSGTPSFNAVNGTTIAPQNLRFELDNKVASPWTATSLAPWLDATPLSGITPATLALRPDPSRGPLASGSYNGDLVLSSPGIASKTVTTQLTLVKPSLSVPSMGVALGGPKGRDLTTPASVALTLNTGTNAWPWRLSMLPSWLAANSTTGTVNGSGTTLGFSAKPAGVPAGTVSALVAVSAVVNGDTVTQPLMATLNVDQRRLLPSQWAVGFADTPTGSVLTRTLEISDNFGGSLNWTASSDSPWLTVTSSGTTDGVSTLVLAADPAALAPPILSYATVTVSTSTPGVEPAVIRVGLWKDATGLSAITKLAENYKEIEADKLRPYVYAHSGGTGIDIYHAYRATRIATIPSVGGALGPMSASPDGSLLYVLDTSDSTLKVIDLKGTAPKVSDSWKLDGKATAWTPLLAIRPNGVEVVLVGQDDQFSGGFAYTKGRSLGRTPLYGTPTASSDGRRVFVQNRGISPASVSAFDVDYSEMSGGVLMVKSTAGTSNINGSSNGADIAVSADGSRLYTATGAPYRCSWVDAATLGLVGSLPGGNTYPNNVEVTSDGRVICGIAALYLNTDFWVHSSTGAIQKTFKVSGYAKTLKDRQLMVTPDGFVVVTLTDDPLIAFVPIGP